jgi:hypothetical protein
VYRHVTLAGALEHRLSRTLAARAGTGVALVSSVQGPLQRVSAWEPVAYGALSHLLERPARIATDLELRYAPYLDVVSGGANQRLEGVATAAWTLSPSWRIAWPAFTEYGAVLAARFELQRPRAERDGRDGGPGGVEGEGAGPGGQAGPGGPGAREPQGRGDEGTRR